MYIPRVIPWVVYGSIYILGGKHMETIWKHPGIYILGCIFWWVSICFHSHMATQKMLVCFFVSWKIHLQMDENWGYPSFRRPPVKVSELRHPCHTCPSDCPLKCEHSTHRPIWQVEASNNYQDLRSLTSTAYLQRNNTLNNHQ